MKAAQKKNHQIQKKAPIELEILSVGKWKSKATHAESICCLDKEEIPESYFQSTLTFFLEIFLFSNMLVRS